MNTQWQQGEYKVATRWYAREQENTRTGYIYGNLFGVERGTWNVTHLPSGYKMPGYFDRLKDAKRYVETIAPLTDWAEIRDSNATEKLWPVRDAVLRASKQLSFATI